MPLTRRPRCDENRPDGVPLENRTVAMSCGFLAAQAACSYWLIRPLRTGFRWIRLASRSVIVLRTATLKCAALLRHENGNSVATVFVDDIFRNAPPRHAHCVFALPHPQVPARKRH